MPDRKIINLYIGLLVCYLAHVIEEIMGGFIVIQLLDSLYIFIMINAVLFFVLLTVLLYLKKGNRRAVLMAIIFSAIMSINGFLHILATIITGRYYNGFAGGITGLVLILVGIPLFIYLYKYYKSNHC